MRIEQMMVMIERQRWRCFDSMPGVVPPVGARGDNVKCPIVVAQPKQKHVMAHTNPTQKENI
jgi:hypothetical protein